MTDTISQDIPEEVIRRAMAIQEEVWTAEARKEPSWRPIAQALLAERKAQREKDAGIAADVTKWIEYEGDFEAHKVAAAIRNQP